MKVIDIDDDESENDINIFFQILGAEEIDELTKVKKWIN